MCAAGFAPPFSGPVGIGRWREASRPSASCLPGAAAARSPFKLTLHLLESQPAFIFTAFANLESEGHLRFA